MFERVAQWVRGLRRDVERKNVRGLVWTGVTGHDTPKWTDV